MTSEVDEPAYQRARREAQSLLNELWDGELPVDLSPIVRALGVRSYRAHLGDQIRAVVSKSKGRESIIVVNSSEPENRGRFALAHQLGHVIERAQIAGDEEYSFRDMRNPRDYDLHELFADELAGALLMPEDEITRFEDEDLTAGQIAATFQVPGSALNTRRRRLAESPD